MRGVLVLLVLACAIVGAVGNNLDLDASPAIVEFTSEHPVDIFAKSANEVDPVMHAAAPQSPKRSALGRAAHRFAQAAMKTAADAATRAYMYARGNGCGTDATAKYIPQGNMLPACDGHDACYTDCNDTKANCDNKFASAMKAICAAKYAGWKKAITRAGCYAQAAIYYEAVHLMGDGAYAGGMAEGGCPDKKK